MTTHNQPQHALTSSRATRRLSLFACAALAVVGCDSGGDDTEIPNGPDADVEEPGPQPRGADNPPTLGAQVDRAGRPAISTALVGTFGGDPAEKGTLRDQYNAAGPNSWASFAGDIQTSLAILDGLDTNCGNQLAADQTETRYAFLASVLADDRLYLNAGSGTCGVYLGLEAEILGVVEAGAGGCGGRTLNDDIVERSYSVLAAGILGGIDDTIEGNDKPNSTSFPFVAEPHE